MELIKGDVLSTYVTVGMSLAQAKKENRNGVKSRFLVLKAKDRDSGLAHPTRIPLFEEELADGVIDMLKNYIKKDASGNNIKDDRGGIVVDIDALKAAPDDYAKVANLMVIPGGMMADYRLRKGACYANNIDGARIKDGREQDVVKDVISVFVQVKFYMPTPEGGMKPTYFAGWGLEERGSRMEAQFYREAVVTNATPEDAEKPANGDPF